MKAKIILLLMSGILLPSLDSYAVDTVYVTGARTQSYVPDYVWEQVRRQQEQAAAAAAEKGRREAEERARRDAEAQAKKAAEEAKKKAIEKQQCLQASNATFEICKYESAQVLSDKTYSCTFLFFNDNALAQCNLAATRDYDARLQGCTVNKTLGDDYCNK